MCCSQKSLSSLTAKSFKELLLGASVAGICVVHFQKRAQRIHHQRLAEPPRPGDEGAVRPVQKDGADVPGLVNVIVALTNGFYKIRRADRNGNEFGLHCEPRGELVCRIDKNRVIVPAALG